MLIIFTITAIHIKAEDPVFKPVIPAYLYSSYEPGLYPFRNSTIYKIDTLTAMTPLAEHDSGSALFGDVLKVRITSGLYAGKTGYICEDYIYLTNSLGQGHKIRLNKDLKINGKILPQDTEFILTRSELNGYDEIFHVADEKGREYKLYDKKLFRYVISEESEILRHLSDGYNVIAAVDSETLLPVPGLAVNGKTTDTYGRIFSRSALLENISNDNYFCYTNDKTFYGHSLLILTPIVRYYAEEQLTIKRYSFEKEGKWTITGSFSDSRYALLSYPGLPDNLIVKECFYIHTPGDILLGISGMGTDHLLAFDGAEWIELPAVGSSGSIRKYRTDRYKFFAVTSGYAGETGELLKITGDETPALFVSDRSAGPVNGGIIENSGGTTLIYPGAYTPFFTNILRVPEGSQSVELKQTERSYTPTELHSVYYGRWERELFLRNGKRSAENVFENFEYVKFSKKNLIEIGVSGSRFKGYFDKIGDDKMIITLLYGDHTISERKYGNTYKLTPGVTSIKIYANLIELGGNLILSFDSTFPQPFISGQTSEDKTDIDTLSAAPPTHMGFPQTPDKACYMIYLFKM